MKFCKQWCSKREGTSGGIQSRASVLGAHQHTLQSFKNTF